MAWYLDTRYIHETTTREIKEQQLIYISLISMFKIINDQGAYNANYSSIKLDIVLGIHKRNSILQNKLFQMIFVRNY